MVVVNELCCGETQHGIAKEFEPLVIFGLPSGNVGEGLLHLIQKIRAGGNVRSHPLDQG